MRALTVSIDTSHADGIRVAVWNRISKYGDDEPFLTRVVDRVKVSGLELGVPEGAEAGEVAFQSKGKRMVVDFDTIRTGTPSVTIAEIDVRPSGQDATPD